MYIYIYIYVYIYIYIYIYNMTYLQLDLTNSPWPLPPLPPSQKKEYILFAALSEWQQGMYKNILDKTLEDSSGKAMKLNNVLMQLRKCCNHPYLFDWPVRTPNSL